MGILGGFSRPSTHPITSSANLPLPRDWQKPIAPVCFRMRGICGNPAWELLYCCGSYDRAREDSSHTSHVSVLADSELLVEPGLLGLKVWIFSGAWVFGLGVRGVQPRFRRDHLSSSLVLKVWFKALGPCGALSRL